MSASASTEPAGPSSRDQAVATLMDACREHFPEPDFTIRCDERSTVWIKQQHGPRSVGLPPWVLREHSLEEVLRRADTKLGPR